ncbi:MAG: hypothetical protein PUK67_08525 [Prevotellaceae bacterium]|nr:hypothetical protein [Prevotellaceae bacterium]MDY3366161.1 hypothetical protein [Prevotella sp.]
MKHLFYKVGIVLTGLFMACSPNSELSDDTKTTNTDAPKGMTTFGGTQQTNKPITRTSIEHSGVGAVSNPFYWEMNDNLWVKKDNTLLKSSSSDITDKAATARFFFNGLFEATQYEVYYRGSTDNATENNVVIAANQVQTQPNSSKHFGASGDCGTATAIRGNDGIYHFSLQHKAAYLCLVPRMTDAGLGENTVLKQVKIVSDAPIAGTYDFSTGELGNASNTSTEITVKCGDTGFPLTGSSSADALAKAGVYAVIAPGSHKLKIEYTIADKTNKTEGVLYQYIDTHQFAKNTLTDIVVDLNTRIVDISQFKYYRWDAKNDLFAGQTNPPHLTDETGTFSTDTWFSQVAEFSAAVNSQKDAPNINETLWYVQKGEPMIENDVLYKYKEHLYKGKGLWLKKQANILGFSKTQAPDGKNYTQEQYTNETAKICSTGRPADPSQYFFLPASGGVAPNKDNASGTLSDVTTEGYYWTSTASITDSPNYYAYLLHFKEDKCYIYYRDYVTGGNLALRRFGMANWKGQ